MKEVLQIIGTIFGVLVFAWVIVSIVNVKKAERREGTVQAVNMVYVACGPDVSVRFKRYIHAADFQGGTARDTAKVWAERCAVR